MSFQKRKQTAYATAGLLSVSSIAYYWYHYHTKVCKSPHLYVSEGELKEQLRKGVPNLFSPYRPSPWLLNPHIMTVAGVLRRLGGNMYERELVTMNDGGTISLDWFADSNDFDTFQPTTPIVLVMHGLTGGSHEGYCKWMCNTAYQHKWRSVVFNYRGCSGVPLTTPKGYSPSVCDDVYEVVEHIKWRWPQAPLFAAAYSLGSLMLCKYLGESDKAKGSRLDGAVMISNPCCMFSSHNRISTPWTIPWVFNLILTYRLRLFAYEHYEGYEANKIHLKDVDRCRTILDFEQIIAYKSFGFPSLEAYRKSGSSQFHIPHIRTKSLIIVAEDDPFIGNLPIDEVLKNKHTALATTERGGHDGGHLVVLGWKTPQCNSFKVVFETKDSAAFAFS